MEAEWAADIRLLLLLLLLLIIGRVLLVMQLRGVIKHQLRVRACLRLRLHLIFIYNILQVSRQVRNAFQIIVAPRFLQESFDPLPILRHFLLLLIYQLQMLLLLQLYFLLEVESVAYSHGFS